MITTIQNGISISVPFWRAERFCVRVLSAYQTAVQVQSVGFEVRYYSPSNTIDIDLTEAARAIGAGGSFLFRWGDNYSASLGLLAGGQGSRPVIVPQTRSGLTIEPPTMQYAPMAGSLATEVMSTETNRYYRIDGGGWNEIQTGAAIPIGYNTSVEVGKDIASVMGEQGGVRALLFTYSRFTGGVYHWETETLADDFTTATRNPSVGDVITNATQGTEWGRVTAMVAPANIEAFAPREACGSVVMLQWQSRIGVTKRHTWLVRRAKFDVGDTIDIQKVDNVVEQLKSTRTAVIAFMGGLSVYDQYYYGDILQSSSVEASFDGLTFVPVRVVSATQEVNMEAAGKLGEVQVEIIVTEDDAV